MKNLNMFLSGLAHKAKKLTLGILSFTILFGSIDMNAVFANGLSKEDLIFLCNQRKELAEELCLLREIIFSQEPEHRKAPINKNLLVKILNLEEEIDALTMELVWFMEA